MTEQQAWPIDNIGPKNEQGAYGVKLKGCGTVLRRTADELAAAGITPPPDPINFDTLPEGTVLVGEVKNCRWNRVKFDGRWWYLMSPAQAISDGDWTVVHVPTPPSLLDALHALGLTDDDIYRIAADGILGVFVHSLVVDAAREAQNQR